MKKLFEEFNNLQLPDILYNEIKLDYTDLNVQIEDEWYDDYWDYSTGKPDQHSGTRTGTIDTWTYYPSDDEVFDVLEKYFNKDLDAITQDEINSLDENKFIDMLYDYCRDSAIADAEENHEWDNVIEDEPDWDAMPGGHDDIDLGESAKKRKPYATKTYTTGSIQRNVDHFNKVLTGKAPNTKLDGLSRTGLCPDGSSSISTSCEGTCGASEGGGIAEGLELQEAKRYVRRYFIRPQHIFCSSKNDIIKALIEIDKTGKNCSVYTLNNLINNDDVTKLTNKDIIYYYDDGILYDKNHVKVMDYDLAVKHEEERNRIDQDKVSDSTFKDVYDDRATELTMDESFALTFEDYNAFGEKLVEGKEKDTICCICGEQIDGYGNNPEPYMSAENGKCCDACNLHFVIPARLDYKNIEHAKADEE